jgi:hypothetical protein
MAGTGRHLDIAAMDIFISFSGLSIFNLLITVKTPELVFWVVTPCGLVGRYQRFGGTYCFLL